MDYSKTVNLPKTDFPMKADLPNREPGSRSSGKSIEIYEKIAGARRAQGHVRPPRRPALLQRRHPHGPRAEQVLKDFIVRYKAMSGYRTPYVPGWDNHGLPIEQKVAEEFRKKHESPTQARDAQGLPRLRREVGRYPARAVQAARDHGRLGPPVSHDEPRIRGRRSSRSSASLPSRATSIAASSRSTGASTTRPRSPRPRSNTPTTRRRRSSCASRW